MLHTGNGSLLVAHAWTHAAKKKEERKKDKKLGATVKHGKHKYMQDGEETLQIKLVEQNVTLAHKPCVMCLLLLLLVITVNRPS